MTNRTLSVPPSPQMICTSVLDITFSVCVCVFCFALLTLNLWMKMFNVSKTLCCTSCAKLLDLEMGT